MSNKTNIEEDIKIVEEMLKDKEEIIKYHTWIGSNALEAIENILADRERPLKEKEIHIKLEQQYKKEYLDEKAKYDSLVEKIKNNLREKEIIKECETISDREHLDGEIFALQELLDTEKENK